MARLSPLLHEQINMLGQYSYSVLEAVAKGWLRPLHNPASNEKVRSALNLVCRSTAPRPLIMS